MERRYRWELKEVIKKNSLGAEREAFINSVGTVVPVRKIRFCSRFFGPLCVTLVKRKNAQSHVIFSYPSLQELYSQGLYILVL